MPYILPLPQIDADSRNSVGEKAYSLSLLLSHNLPVNEGFVVTIFSQKRFFTDNDLLVKFKQELCMCNPDDPASVATATTRLKKLVLNSRFPQEIADEVYELYEKLTRTKKATTLGTSPKGLQSWAKSGTGLSVRCSYPRHNPVPPHPLYLGIRGEHTLLELIKDCWAAQITPQIVQSHSLNRIPEVAILVQAFFDSTVTGIAHTIDPYNATKHTMVIEAAWGMGDPHSQVQKYTDRYGVDSLKGEITYYKQTPQYSQRQIENGSMRSLQVPLSHIDKPKLSSVQIATLFRMLKKLKRIQIFPMTVEWGYDGKEYCFFQVQELENSTFAIGTNSLRIFNNEVITEGQGISPGLGFGKMVQVEERSDYGDSVILIHDADTKPQKAFMQASGMLVVNMKSSSDLVLFAREYGIPVVNLHKQSLRYIHQDQIVTIDGTSGLVYKGSVYQASSSALSESHLTIAVA